MDDILSPKMEGRRPSAPKSPPPNVGKKRRKIRREIRFDQELDGTYLEHFSPSLPVDLEKSHL